MKILFFGCGSIGQRHIRNIRELFSDTVEISAKRTELYSNEDDSFINTYNVKIFNDDKSAFENRPDIVFVTNPTSLHLETAFLSLQHNCHVFIEKPLAPNISNVIELKKLAEKTKRHIFIGYCLRYHPLIKLAKKHISLGSVGEIFFADVYFGTYLPLAHPWRNYKEIFRGKKEFGGGAALELSHELDYIQWLFGKPIEISAYENKLGKLEINCDDLIDIRMHMANGTLVHANMNFLQQPPVRTCRIIGEDGSIFMDLIAKKMVLYNSDNKDGYVYDYSDWEENQMFVEEVINFFQNIKENKPMPVNLEDGQTVIEMIEASRLSSRTQKVVKLI